MDEIQTIITRVFLMGVLALKKGGKTEREIADELNVSVSKLRAAIAVAKSEIHEKAS